jgi:hypothetical protein
MPDLAVENKENIEMFLFFLIAAKISTTSPITC